MFSVCSHLEGGVPISHNALQHFPGCHGADTRGGGTLPGPAGGGGLVTLLGGLPCRGDPAGGRYPAGGRVPCQGGYPARGDTLLGGTQVGQQKEYSIHGGRYASCVHAGGLSCLFFVLEGCHRRVFPDQ